MTLRYISIDPATSTGWASFEAHAVEQDRFRIDLVSHGQFRVNTRTTTNVHGAWCLDMERHIDELLDTILLAGSITHAFVEDYFFSARACNGVTINVKFRAVIEMCLYRRGIEYTLVHPGSWFAAVVGSVPKRTPTHERKQRTARALEVAFGIVIPSHIGRRKTPSDVYDAIAIGVHGILQRHRATADVHFSVAQPFSAPLGVAVEGSNDGVVRT